MKDIDTMALDDEPGSSRSRIPRSGSQPATSIRDEENDFPFTQVSFARIGSAHIVCKPRMDSDSASLMARICSDLMKRYQPQAPPPKVFFDLKTTDADDTPLIEYIPDADAADDTSSHFFRDQQLLKLMYLCVQVQGTLPSCEAGYCYFGVFADQFLQFWKTYQSDLPFNPKTIQGIVLARSSGLPSPEIQEFMRHRFSFGEDCCILEVSRT